jgi:hypothetical protein
MFPDRFSLGAFKFFALDQLVDVIHALSIGKSYVVPDRLRVLLHPIGFFAHELVEYVAMLRINDVLQDDEAIPVEGNDCSRNVLICHAA